jgi:hypothetical protein
MIRGQSAPPFSGRLTGRPRPFPGPRPNGSINAPPPRPLPGIAPVRRRPPPDSSAPGPPHLNPGRPRLLFKISIRARLATHRQEKIHPEANNHGPGATRQVLVSKKCRQAIMSNYRQPPPKFPTVLAHSNEKSPFSLFTFPIFSHSLIKNCHPPGAAENLNPPAHNTCPAAPVPGPGVPAASAGPAPHAPGGPRPGPAPPTAAAPSPATPAAGPPAPPG